MTTDNLLLIITGFVKATRVRFPLGFTEGSEESLAITLAWQTIHAVWVNRLPRKRTR